MTGRGRTGADAHALEAEWSLYGVRLRSEHVFVNNVERADRRSLPNGDAVSFAYVDDVPLPQGWDGTAPTFASAAKIADDTSFLYVLEVGVCSVLRFSEVVDFFVWPDRILCRVLDPAYGFMVELHLLGFVMAFWLERRGVLALHAAGVAVHGHAIGFLATNAGGKSSLAASLMQVGHPLLSDDILPVEPGERRPLVRPSYPQMRMWPETARHFVGTTALPHVHPRLEKRRVPVGRGGFGRFERASLPLAVLYVPERVESGEVTFCDVSFAEATFALERYAFLAEMLTGTGLQRRRFATVAAVAATVPLRRVAYPTGLHLLPAVAAAIAADAAEVTERRASAAGG